jgi:penicillin-binding protein 1A
MREQDYISAAEEAEAEPADVKLVPTPKQNSVRYFTDWVLPQLDTLIDETVEPIDVWTTLDLSMQRAADQAINANTPAGAARSAGIARPGRRDPGNGRRPRLCDLAL